MSSPPSPGSGREPRGEFGATAAGASTGTIIAALANNLPDGDLKSWIVILAPAIAVGVSRLWTWVAAGIARRRVEKELAVLLPKLRQTVQDRLSDPSITSARRAELERELEEIDTLYIQTEVERVKVLLTRRH